MNNDNNFPGGLEGIPPYSPDTDTPFLPQPEYTDLSFSAPGQYPNPPYPPQGQFRNPPLSAPGQYPNPPYPPQGQFQNPPQPLPGQYPNPPYPPRPPYQTLQPYDPAKGLSTAALILGLVSIVMGFIGLSGIIGLILSIVAINNYKNADVPVSSTAKAGLICSIIGIAKSLANIFIFVAPVIFGVFSSY